jgi:two-component system, OmpR family, sensor kinase
MVEISVRTRGDEAILSVRDDGPGIPPDLIDSVFSRYRRLGRGRSGSTGLGLYIVRGIVEAHGGRIGVSSVPGEGTIFEVHLPAGLPGPLSPHTP